MSSVHLKFCCNSPLEDGYASIGVVAAEMERNTLIKEIFRWIGSKELKAEY